MESGEVSGNSEHLLTCQEYARRINVANPFRKRGVNSWIEFELLPVPKKGKDYINALMKRLISA